MVALGARRSAGAGPGDVDLLDPVERRRPRARRGGSVKPGENPAPTTIGTPRSVGLGVEVEEVADVVGIVGDRHHRHAAAQQRGGRGAWAPAVGEHGDVGRRRRSGSPVAWRSPSPRAATTAAARSAGASATTTSTPSDTSCRAARAPTAPAPTTSAARSPSSPEIGAGELPPAAALGRRAAGAADPEHGGHETGEPEGDESTAQEGHRVGLGGIEPPTSSLSAMRSNRLS